MVSIADRPTIPKDVIGGRAAIYIRVSSDRQESGASLGMQLDTCRRYCEQAGLEIVGEFKDIESGLHIDRPQYQSALKLAKAKGFDQLVVWRYDRSGRDDAEYATMLRDFAKLGIRLVSSSGESPDPLYQKLAGVLAWDESRRSSMRITGSKMKRFEDGYWNTKPPFGYVNEKQPEGGSILVAKPGESELVTGMFEQYATGKHSLRDIQRWVNNQGIDKPKSRRGINQILASRVYLGEVPFGKYVNSQFHPKPDAEQWRPGKHQALITQEVFDRVQQLFHQNKRSWGKGNQGKLGPSRGGPNARYLFTGLIYCDVCGSRYIGSPPGRNKWPNYRCGRKHTGTGCTGRGVYEPRIRAAVIPRIEALLRQLSDQDVKEAVMEEILRQQEEQNTAATLDRLGLTEQLERVEARLTRLENAYLDGDLTRDRYRIRRDEITVRAKDLSSQLQDTPEPVIINMGQLFAIAEGISVDDLDSEAWRDLVVGMVDRIVISSGEDDGRKAPATVEVVWKPEYAALMGAKDSE